MPTPSPPSITEKMHSDDMQMPESHTGPALSRFCVIFFFFEDVDKFSDFLNSIMAPTQPKN